MSSALVAIALASYAFKAHRESEYAHRANQNVEGRSPGYSRYGEYIQNKYNRDHYGSQTNIPQVGTVLVDRSMRRLNVAPTPGSLRRQAQLKHRTMSSMMERPARVHGPLREGGLFVTPKTDRYGYHSKDYLSRAGPNAPNTGGVGEIRPYRPAASYGPRFENRK